MSAMARGKTLPPLVVRYPKRMRPRKTYSVRVSWRGQPPRLGDEAPKISVRLVMGGAQVVPSELPMDPNRPSENAVFSVTPLAKGWLRREHLQVLADGVKVQEIPLPAKVISQRKAWICLILAFLIPWALIRFVHVGKYNDMYRGSDPWHRYVQKHTPIDWVVFGSADRLEQIGVPRDQYLRFWGSMSSMFNVGWQTIMDDALDREFLRADPDTKEEQPPKDNGGNANGKKKGDGGNGQPKGLPQPKLEEKKEENGAKEKKEDPDDPKAGANPGGEANGTKKDNGAAGEKKIGGKKPGGKKAGGPFGMGKKGGGGKKQNPFIIQPPPEGFGGPNPQDQTIPLNLPFYCGVFFFVLAVLFAFFGRQRYRKRVGRPLSLAIIEE